MAMYAPPPARHPAAPNYGTQPYGGQYAAPQYNQQRPVERTRSPYAQTYAAPPPEMMDRKMMQQPQYPLPAPRGAPTPMMHQAPQPQQRPATMGSGQQPASGYWNNWQPNASADMSADFLANELMLRAPPGNLARPSLRRVPGSSNAKGKLQLLMGMVYQPLAGDVSVPVVNMGQTKVVRCQKCRSYINPFVKWTDNGNSWQCNFCDQENATPQAYYYALDNTGQRQDRQSHPELCNGAVEFVASPDYMNRAPMAPCYMLLMDVTVNAVQSGLVATVCQSLKQVISEDKLVGLERATFTIVTFDSNIHFYSIQQGQTTPHISVVPGTAEPFLPAPEGILADVKDRKNEIIHLLDDLPRYWQNQEETESNVPAALNAAKALLRATGGKIMFVLSTLPLSPELGLNPNHEIRDPKTRNSSRLTDEIDGLKPSSTYFTTLTHNLAHQQISIDVFAAPAHNNSMDLASIGQLAKGSGGDLYYYPMFRPQTWGEKLRSELYRNLTRQAGWEGVMRVRISRGWKIESYSGNYCFRGVDLMMVPHMHEDQSIVITFDTTDSVAADSACYLQLALLYTTSDGERRIRSLTTGLQTSVKLPELSQSVDVDAMTHIITCRAMEEAMKGKLADARSYIQAQVANTVGSLSLSCSTTPPPQDPSYPLDEANPILSIILNCAGMFKSAAFREGKDIAADFRAYLWHRLRTFPIDTVLRFFRPVLFDIARLPPQAGMTDDSGMVQMPQLLRLSSRVMSADSAYMLCDGEAMYVWIGRGIKTDWMSQALGVPSFDQIITEYTELAFGATGSPLGNRLGAIMNQLRKYYKANCMKIVICKQGEPNEYKFMQGMIEDKTQNIGVSFYELWQKLAMSRSMGMSTPQAGYAPYW